MSYNIGFVIAAASVATVLVQGARRVFPRLHSWYVRLIALGVGEGIGLADYALGIAAYIGLDATDSLAVAAVNGLAIWLASIGVFEAGKGNIGQILQAALQVLANGRQPATTAQTTVTATVSRTTTPPASSGDSPPAPVEA